MGIENGRLILSNLPVDYGSGFRANMEKKIKRKKKIVREQQQAYEKERRETRKEREKVERIK